MQNKFSLNSGNSEHLGSSRNSTRGDIRLNTEACANYEMEKQAASTMNTAQINTI